jgi:DNA-binding CsgD family transcriptional regulator
MNRHSDAAAILADVRATAEALGSEPLLARAGEISKASRGRGLEDEPWRPLTIREFEVARLIAEGLTNGEIADRLSIAPKTASAHVEHILTKLGATRRAEIAAWTAGVTGAASPAAVDRAGAAAGARA